MKKTFLLFAVISLLFFSNLNSFAQTPNWLWAHSAGAVGYEYGRSVVVDSLGNSYFAGDFGTTISFDATHTIVSAGSGDIFIVKYDPNGNVIWVKSAGGTDNEAAGGISIDATGNVFVAGYFKSATVNFGTTTLTNAGGNTYDIFVTKLDNNGNFLWAKGTGGTGDDRAYGIATDLTGNCFITGYFVSTTVTFGSTAALTRTGPSEVYIAKYATDGTALWAKSSVSTGWVYSYAITVDLLGNAIIAGDFAGTQITFGSNVLVLDANRDIFVVKYASDGSIVWAKRAGTSGDNTAYAVAADTSGNVFVGGRFFTSITFGATTPLTSAGIADIFIVKYTADGTPLWAKSAGGSLEDIAKGITTDRLGYCYLAGFFKSASINFGFDTLTNAGTGTSDLFVTEFDPFGNVVWAKSAGSTGDEYIASIAVDTLRNFFITGNFGSPTFELDTTTLYTAGTTDPFFAKADNLAPSGINEIAYPMNISVFPNPANDYITFLIPEKAKIEILNITGQVVRTTSTDGNAATLDLRNLSSGVYILKATTNNGVVTKKFIKE